MVARCLNTGHVRGMGRYVQELLRCGAQDDDLRWTLLGNDPRHPMHAPQAPTIGNDVFEFRGDRFELWEQVGLPQRARGHRIDVLHCTEGSLPWWQPVPTVVTVHDTLAWQERPDTRWNRLYWDQLLPAALQRCAAVITISESSRRDIVAKWPALEAKTTVIPHGIGEEYLRDAALVESSALQRSLGERPYLVYLGGPMRRKRFDWAVRVLQHAAMPDLQLVACGFAGGAVQSARASVPGELQSRVHFAPFLSNDELVALYRTATAVLYPTLYEGFGFPVIEAQACGAPIIFSPVSSLTELVGPSSLLVPTHDLPAWCDAVRTAAARAPQRAARLAAARAWAQGFSWQNSFVAHREVYVRAARAHRSARCSAG